MLKQKRITPMVLNMWIATLSQGSHQISCILDIYITNHNSSKVTVRTEKPKILWLGWLQHEEVYWRVVALGRSRTTAMHKYSQQHYSICQKVGITKMSLTGVSKQYIVQSYPGILHSQKNESLNSTQGRWAMRTLVEWKETDQRS